MKSITENKSKPSENYLVASFYFFRTLDENLIVSLLDDISSTTRNRGIKGTVLLASEGINGTICGKNDDVNELLKIINSASGDKPVNLKFSTTKKQTFRKFKVRRKAEIVTMGIDSVKPSKNVGTYVEPRDWNLLLDDPDTIVIDTRNDYEILIGTFDGAINPHTRSFREFPEWVDENLKTLVKNKSAKKIAMFCTGGIRCEKATSYLQNNGFKDVYHLRGGILEYLNKVSKKESRWHGECFVFDQRVSLDHELSPGIHSLCYACGMPLNPSDRNDLSYIRGVQCHYCENSFTDSDRKRFAERQKHFDKLFELTSK